MQFFPFEWNGSKAKQHKIYAMHTKRFSHSNSEVIPFSFISGWNNWMFNRFEYCVLFLLPNEFEVQCQCTEYGHHGRCSIWIFCAASTNLDAGFQNLIALPSASAKRLGDQLLLLICFDLMPQCHDQIASHIEQLWWTEMNSFTCDYYIIVSFRVLAASHMTNYNNPQVC